jgi:molybdate/tungstate transport system substrate-binding protein
MCGLPGLNRILCLTALLLATATLATACGSAARSGRSHRDGSVSVLYAGSLQAVMNNRIAPAFQRATGNTFNGYPAGSKDLASEIRGRVRVGDVFVSASAGVDATLEGPGSGNWVSWYAPFATTDLVLGYNPHSGFARELRTRPWYRVITQPGFRLGFTDPKLDPKGALVLSALDQAAARYGEPALKRVAASQSDLFPEEDLVGRLEAGQLDAGFFYTVEAAAARIPTVSLGPIHESAMYTITVLKRAPHPAAAATFVRFLLGPTGRSLLRGAGARIVTPRAVGAGVPPSLRSAVRSRR